jgi:hypothetical protein
VAVVAEVQRGWCSSHGGWKMWAGIGVGMEGVLTMPFIGPRR